MCTYARYWNVVALTYDQTGIVTEEPENRYVLEEARINGIPVRGVPDLPGAITWPSTNCCWSATLWTCRMSRN